MAERVTVYMNEEVSREMRRIRKLLLDKSGGTAWTTAKILEMCFLKSKDRLLEEVFPGIEILERQKSRLRVVEREIDATRSVDRLERIIREIWDMSDENKALTRSTVGAGGDLKDDEKDVFWEVRQRILALSNKAHARIAELEAEEHWTKDKVWAAMDSVRGRSQVLGATTSEIVRQGREERRG